MEKSFDLFLVLHVQRNYCILIGQCCLNVHTLCHKQYTIHNIFCVLIHKNCVTSKFKKARREGAAITGPLWPTPQA